MPINGEPFERGEYVEHISGTKYLYEGRVPRVNIWGSLSSDENTFHILASSSGSLYLEPDRIFQKNYRHPGGWHEPAEGQIWRHGGMTRTVVVRKVIDDLVVYDYENEKPTPVHYARSTDEFVKEFRYGAR